NSNLEMRLSALEQQIRELTGKIERQGFEISKAQKDLEKFTSDTEMRLKQLEGNGSTPSTTNSNTGNLNLPASGSDRVMDENVTTTPARPLNHLGQRSDSTVITGSSEESYDSAFALLRKNDFKGAENAFRKFI